jgi:hypothetical protein
MAVTAVFEHPPTALVDPAAAIVKDRVTFTLNDVSTGDVSIVVTHNMNMSVEDLAAGFPIVVVQPLRDSARYNQLTIGTVALPGVLAKATNAISLSMVIADTAGDSGIAVAQVRIHLLRPHTIGR